MLIKVGEKEFDAEFNGLTPIVFSRTFTVEKLDADGKPTGACRPKDINEDVSLIAETLATCNMPAMSALLEIFYACVKTADLRLKQTFNEWVQDLPREAFDLQMGDGWAADVMKIVEDNFFPSANEELDPAAAETSSATATE